MPGDDERKPPSPAPPLEEVIVAVLGSSNLISECGLDIEDPPDRGCRLLVVFCRLTTFQTEDELPSLCTWAVMSLPLESI